MSGGGGGETTNVTNTGIGDDQYQTLADNQVGISGQIDTARDDATARYDSFDGRFGDLDTSLSGLSTDMLSQFKNSTDNVNTQFTNMGGRFDGMDSSLAANNQGIGNIQSSVEGVGADVLSGFATTQDRFDTVDTANQTMQDDMTAGFTDQAQGFSDVQGAMTDNTANIRDDITSNFQSTNDALASSETNIRDDVQNSQANVLEGQGGISTDLSDLSATNDTYFDALATNQDNMQSNQEGFQTNFDGYLDRYSDDTTLANQSRADIATAQANSADAVRDDLGTFAQAAATGQQNLSTQLGGVAEGVGEGLMAVGETVEGGFSSAATDQLTAQQNLTTRLGGLKDKLASTGDTLDANSKAQFESLSNSFDDQGNVIANSIDAQGNTINRSMDDQGNLIETKFAATGEQIGQSTTNINDALTAAENTLSGNIGTVGTAMEQGFNASTQASTDQFNQLQSGNEGLMAEVGAVGQANADQTAQLQTSVDQNAQAAAQTADTSTQNNMDQFAQLQQSMTGGFQNMDTNSINQARDLAGIASTQSDLDIGMRQNFKQLSTSFDDNGALIANSVDEQGNTLSRAIDQNGNLLMRSFDSTGKSLGNKVININQSLYDLSRIKRVPGANISMGNLSPASQGVVPTSGFMSPFSQTY